MDESNNNNIPGAAASPESGQPQQTGQTVSQPEAVQAQSDDQQQIPAPVPSAAQENPFASVAVASGASAILGGLSEPSSQTDVHAAPQPAQPYYEASAVQAAAQPYAYESYQVPYGTAQDSYGSCGASVQPPIPPVPPAQNVYPGYEAPQAAQKRRWPWFLLGLAVGLVIGLGGCVSCVSLYALADFGSNSSNTYDYSSNDDGYRFDNGGDNGYYSWPPEDDNGAESPSAAPEPGTYSLEEITTIFQPDGVTPSTPGEGDVCAKGIYTVGPNGQIPAGLYYLEGSNEKLSHFYVFDGDDGRYKLDDSVQYFGNYYTDLDEGDLIVFVPGEDVSMHPASSTSTNPTAPYTNGCYRVGIDIPAGSYTITAATVGEGETDEDSAAFVMKNLDFDDDSIVDTKYVIPGGEQTVTVSNGQYLELFAATATPVAQG